MKVLALVKELNNIVLQCYLYHHVVTYLLHLIH